MDPNTTTSSLANAINLNTAHRQVIPLTLFVAVLCLCLVIGHLLNENRWVNESITAIIIGCVVGTIILCTSKWKSSQLLRFDEELFFIYLLPPIIFNAGFSVKKKQFFHNFFPIMLFGVIGVFISTSIVAAGCWWLFPKLGFKGLTISEYLSIGTIFSSTDTVCTLQVLHQDETPLLYSLVFGEGVVNDATSVVLFNAVRKITANTLGVKAALRIVLDFLYLFSTSTLLGVALFELSGILTVFFSGVLMSHYAWHNVTESSRVTTKHAFAAMSFIAETFIFLYVGMDALDYEKWKMSILSFWTSIGIYSTVMFLILLGRAAFVFPLSLIANYLHRSDDPSSKITGQHQVVIWWAGLMRGAVSVALAFKQFTLSGVTLDPINATMITTTTVIVLFSTVVFGFLTKPLIRYLLPTNPRNASLPRSTSPKEDITLPLLSFEESASENFSRAKENMSMLMERPVYTIHSYWRRFDDTYMRPIFGGARNSNLS
ncbi:putative cation/H+ exchanger, cation/H+ exchanger, CPA1 family [Helianthus annuus]|nr:putative cation/H+ exchanger, cation/H+ exchanger, CPA1 family [Helianthus annuus]